MIDAAAYTHELVHQNCGRVAFYLRLKPEPFSPLRSADVVRLSGEPFKPMDSISCGSCGERIIRPRIGDIREAALCPA